MTHWPAMLIGRDRELEILARFLEHAAADGGAFLLMGAPGAGKTALLDAAADAAEEAGTGVLRAAGAEFEADLAYSGLHQVLLPVSGQFERLGATHRNALNVALGYGDGPPPDRLLVSTATLTVLLQAAAARPVLIVVDDLPWLDRASAGVLGFVARRLAGSRLGFLTALRPGEESFFERAGLPQHELEPLDEQAANVLVSSRFPKLAPRVRLRVGAEAQGNPLALLELPAMLSDAQRAAAEALPVVLPLSGDLRTARCQAVGCPGRRRAARDRADLPRADLRERDPLTPQEREIAMLAAAGMSNNEIGQRLSLSHRTVGAHLYQISPKLGITSRAALRDALAELPEPPQPGSPE
jgi:DNA-binding CsgD family transcriptional regulator